MYTHCDLWHALHWSRHTHHMSCPLPVSRLPVLCGVHRDPGGSSGALLCWVTSARMFSKDASFQVSRRSVPEPFLDAIKARSLDQPGVLVAKIDGVLEDGMLRIWVVYLRVLPLFLLLYPPISRAPSPLLLSRIPLHPSLSTLRRRPRAERSSHRFGRNCCKSCGWRWVCCGGDGFGR